MAKEKQDSKSDDNKERTTLYMSGELLKKIKLIAVIEDLNQSDTINEALSEYVARYEKKNGPLPAQKS